MDTQQQEGPPELVGNIVIPKVAVLRTMAAFLPYIVILALSSVIAMMYADNRADNKERINDLKSINAERKELNDTWREGFVETYKLLQTAAKENHEHRSQDSSSADNSPASRQRR